MINLIHLTYASPVKPITIKIVNILLFPKSFLCLYLVFPSLLCNHWSDFCYYKLFCFLEFYINKIIQYILFLCGFFHPILRFHPCCYHVVLSFLLLGSISLYGYTTIFLYIHLCGHLLWDLAKSFIKCKPHIYQEDCWWFIKTIISFHIFQSIWLFAAWGYYK